MATIYGTTNNDQLTTGSGGDTVLAGLGSDTIVASTGNDLINAGTRSSAVYWRLWFNDFDLVDYRFMGGAVRVDLGLGRVEKSGAGGVPVGTDTLVGVDAVQGSDFADSFIGRDFWRYERFTGGGGANQIDGRGGIDEADYSDASSISANLQSGLVTHTRSNGTTAVDTLRNIEILTATSGNDTIDAQFYSGQSANRNSFDENWNVVAPRGGDDTVRGNAQTVLDYAGVGGAITVNLALQAPFVFAPGVVVEPRAVLTNALTGSFFSSNGLYAPGNDLVSGVSGVYGGAYNDQLDGGARVNGAGSRNTLSGDASLESFRGNGGQDLIRGITGMDRSEYNVTGQSEGIVVDLGLGSVSGDPLMTGTDQLRGIESIASTHLDDRYVAVGFSLFGATSPSTNNGDVQVALPAGETLPSLAFNEFVVYGGNDRVDGNGATRLNFSQIFVETLSATATNVQATINPSARSQATYGLTDGGYGSVDFASVYSIVGSAGRDVLTGGAGFQELQGYFGDDSLRGGDGHDILFGNLGQDDGLLPMPATVFTDNDRLYGEAGDDLLRGDKGNDYLSGGIGADRLFGGVGNDVLDGGPGADVMEGGTDSDSYYVDDPGDSVIEHVVFPGLGIGIAVPGVDIVNATISYVLSSSVENLTLQGTAAIDGTGNSANNQLIGNAANNVLSGMAGNDNLDGKGGADTMIGGPGSDTYLVDNAGDVVQEADPNPATGGYDTVRVLMPGPYTYQWPANVEYLGVSTTPGILGASTSLATAIGDAANNTFLAGGGYERWDGAGGIDTVTYKNYNNPVAIDLTLAVQEISIWDLDWLERIENLTGTPASGDRLTGDAQANALDGGAGADTLTGNDGSDLYYVDDAGDVIIESNADATTGGRDTVVSTVTRTLEPNVENLRLNAARAIDGIGNALDNAIYAGGGNNNLNGGLGNDTVSYLYATAGVTLDLALSGAQNTLGSGTDTLTGFENLAGSAFRDVLRGDAGANRIDGGAGVDTLQGRDGNDTYYVDDVGDVVTEDSALATGGIDMIVSKVSYALGPNVENLRLDGHGALDGTGNTLGNWIEAGGGNNRIDGGSGHDTVSYAGAGAGVTVSLTLAGAQATGGSATDTLLGIESLVGSRFNDTLTGDALPNNLRGGAGSDTLQGGRGADSYQIDSALGSDTIIGFERGLDRVAILQSGVRVGNGNTTIDAPETLVSPGRFSTAAELVVITGNLPAGPITAAAAAAHIGQAGNSYARGQTALFAVDNGVDSALFLFTSNALDPLVSSTELSLLVTLPGVPETLPTDYLFGP